MKINEQVRYHRKAQGITALELSRMSEVNNTTISLFETGRIAITTDTLEKLVTSMDCDLIIFPKNLHG